MSRQNIPQQPQSNSAVPCFLTTGVNSYRGMPLDEKQGVLPVCQEPLAIAQQPLRDFLTAERGSVSVKV